MKLQSLRHILSGFATMALLSGTLMATGCTDSHEVMEDVGSAEVFNVEFRIKAGNAVPTRATEEYGTVEECHIDLDNLKILIFDESQTLMQVLYDNGKMDEDVTSFIPTAQGDYLLRTKLDPALYNLNSKFAIVALANWRSADDDKKLITRWNGFKIDETEVGKLTVGDLAKMTFTLNPDVTDGPQPESWIPGNGHWIPMFGSRYTSLAGYNNAIFNEGNPMAIPDVNLVRAISKIEITNLDTTPYSPKITGIVLTHRHQHGRLMPDYTFTGATSQVSSVSIPEQPGYTTAECPFQCEGNVYTLYLPEIGLADAPARNAICINLDMNGVEHQKRIYLAPYSVEGLPDLTGPYDSDWDAVKRNYIYRYTVNSLAFEFLVDVNPWIFGGKVHINLE